jgi:hypothetical protein
MIELHYIIWFNLAVQFAVVFSGMLYLHFRRHARVSMPNVCLLNESTHEASSSGWHPDILTQTIVELAATREKVIAHDARLAELDIRYVTKAEFVPVRMVVYGMVGVILTTALLSILVLIWRTK